MTLRVARRRARQEIKDELKTLVDIGRVTDLLVSTTWRRPEARRPGFPAVRPPAHILADVPIGNSTRNAYGGRYRGNQG